MPCTMRKSSWTEVKSRVDMLNAKYCAFCSEFSVGSKLNSLLIERTYFESNSFCIAGDF